MLRPWKLEIQFNTNTEKAVYLQIAEMTMALIRNEPMSQLQVLWQPELQAGVTAHPPKL